MEDMTHEEMVIRFSEIGLKAFGGACKTEILEQLEIPIDPDYVEYKGVGVSRVAEDLDDENEMIIGFKAFKRTNNDFEKISDATSFDAASVIAFSYLFGAGVYQDIAKDLGQQEPLNNVIQLFSKKR